MIPLGQYPGEWAMEAMYWIGNESRLRNETESRISDTAWSREADSIPDIEILHTDTFHDRVVGE